MKRFLLIALASFGVVFSVGGAALINVGTNDPVMPATIEIVD
jgi:hypothetical protein